MVWCRITEMSDGNAIQIDGYRDLSEDYIASLDHSKQDRCLPAWPTNGEDHTENGEMY